MEGEQETKNSSVPIFNLEEKESEEKSGLSILLDGLDSNGVTSNDQLKSEEEEKDGLLDRISEKDSIESYEHYKQGVALKKDNKKWKQRCRRPKLEKFKNGDPTKWTIQLWCNNETNRDNFLSEMSPISAEFASKPLSNKVMEIRKVLTKFLWKEREAEDYSKFNSFALLASKEGNFNLLKIFLSLNKHGIRIKFISTPSYERLNLRIDSIEILKTRHERGSDFCDVEGRTEDSRNILHVLFQRPYLKDSKDQTRGLMKYRKCSKILLDPQNWPKKNVIYRLVNEQDVDGNTPLHYALKGWSQETVSQLLEYGANIGIENNNNEDPLSNIPREWLQNYLDKKCIEQTKSEFVTHDAIHEYEKELNKEGTIDISEEIKPLYREMIRSNKSVTFDYSFLALKTDSKPSKKRRVYETDVLHKLSVLSEACDENLLLHPVLRFFIWIKWARLKPYVFRKLTLQFLFCICTSWFLLIKYDSKKVDGHCFFHFLNVIFDGNAMCETSQSKERGVEGLIFHKNEYDFQHLPGCNERIENLDHHFNGYNSCFQYCSLGYIVFIIQFMIQIYAILKNYRRVLPYFMKKRVAKKEGKPRPQPLSRSGKLVSPLSFIPAVVCDIFNLTFQFLIIIGGRCYLTWVLRIFLPVALAFRCSKAIYWISMNLKSVIDKKQELLYHFLEILHAVLLIALFFFGITDSLIARGLTAILLFFLWFDFLLDVVVYGSYNSFIGHFKMYVMKFAEVTNSFLKVLFWYSAFLIIFGLGFHILFQSDFGPTEENEYGNKASTNSTMNEMKTVDGNPNVFGSRISSIVKTFAMFVGEIDFDNLPMNHTKIENDIRYERLGVMLAYGYFIIFVFIAVIVLMNLLNAIAIQSAKQITKKARFLEEENRINVLLYSDFWARFLLNVFRKLPDCCKINRVYESLMRYTNIFFAPEGSYDLDAEREYEDKINNRVLLWTNSGKTQDNNECIKIKARDDTLKKILRDAQDILVQNCVKSFEDRKNKNFCY